MKILRIAGAREGFTLMEVLIVMAIIATALTVMVLIMNPAQMLKRLRDSSRMQDLATIERVGSLFASDQSGELTGTSSIVYVSVPDSSSSCANLGLPSLPSGWSYHCSSSETFRSVDGSGWIPADLTGMSYNPPLAVWPVDPLNTTSTGHYYTYTAAGSFHLTALLEADKYALGGDDDQSSVDGGKYPELYEKGTDMELLPISRDPDLVGYWSMDEGQGTTVYQRTGRSSDGSFVDVPAWQTGSSCVVGGCLSFDGVDDGVAVTIPAQISEYSILAWVNLGRDGTSPDRMGIVNGTTCFGSVDLVIFENSGQNLSLERCGQFNSGAKSSASIQLDTWTHVAATVTSNMVVRYYVNGSYSGTYTGSPGHEFGMATSFRLGKGARNFEGLLDEVRIYSKTLTDQEVAGIYNSSR